MRKKMSPTVEVHVHKCHVARAREARGLCNAARCMIAQAIGELVPTAKNIKVDGQTIRFTDPAKRRRYVYLTPPVAQKNLVAFDEGRFNEIDYFKFTLAHAIKVLPAVQTGGKQKPRTEAQDARHSFTDKRRKTTRRTLNRVGGLCFTS